MNNSYSFFKYVSKTSYFHLMNSKNKILLLLLTLVSIILLRTYTSSLILFLYLVYIMFKTNISFDIYINNIFLVWPLYLLIFLITFFLTFNINASLLWVIKVIYIVLVLLILTFTTSLSEIAWGFECLFNKLNKIHMPVSKIALKIALCIKFISTLFEQSKLIRKSLVYKGIAYKKLSIFKIIKLMIIPSIYLSYKLSTRVISVMKLRFYGSSKKRSNYHENKVKKFDNFLIFLCVIILYMTIWLGWIR